MKKAIASMVVVFCISIVSCQTTAQKNIVLMAEKIKTILQKDDVCISQVSEKPQYRPLYQRLSRDKTPTLAQLTDNVLPTKEEVELIIAEHNDRAHCREMLIEGLMDFSPSIASVFVQHYYALDLILSDLIERKITWGEANKKFRAVSLESSAKIETAVGELKREFTVSHQAELAQRQAAYNSFRQWRQNQEALRQNQQMIDSLNRPVITDCTKFGSSVRCTSR